MKAQDFLIGMAGLLLTPPSASANTATDAAAAAAIQTVSNTASVVILRSAGIGVNIVTTPNGAQVLPATQGSTTTPPDADPNGQAQKNSFFNGNN